jgi:hypothetical protein
MAPGLAEGALLALHFGRAKDAGGCARPSLTGHQASGR